MAARKSPEEMSKEELVFEYKRLRESMKTLLSKAKEAEAANEASSKKEQALKKRPWRWSNDVRRWSLTGV